MKRLGIRQGGRGDGKNIHEIRDVFRSKWEISIAKPSVSEFMMGHQVDKMGYNKAHRDENWVIKEYRKALPLLQLMSSGRPYGQVEEDEVDSLRDIVKGLEAQLVVATRNTSEKDVEFNDMKKDVNDIKTLLSLPQLKAILAQLNKEALEKGGQGKHARAQVVNLEGR
ncbi:unnamed protein product [marine sediment metagenome]|uniref:Uncharacterized protein n=1 Tax=marine sediment metagenome TaxID=412755 RepID=X1EDT8_9ZZZZ